MKTFLRLIAMVSLVFFMSACDSSSEGGLPDVGDGVSTCIDLNSLSTPSTIASETGELELYIILGSEEASVQYIAGNDLVWQNPIYSYTVSGNSITFTRTGDEIEETYLEGLNPPGAVVPMALSVSFSSNIVRNGVKLTYDNLEYTVLSAFDNDLKMSCN